jgi:hypothetical protein
LILVTDIAAKKTMVQTYQSKLHAPRPMLQAFLSIFPLETKNKESWDEFPQYLLREDIKNHSC